METAHHELSQSPTHHPTRLDTMLWVCGILYWGALALVLAAFVFLLFRPPAPAVRRSGTATINQLGDVVQWTPEAAAVTGHAEMFGKELFSLLPPTRRNDVRRDFLRGVDGAPYQFPRIGFPVDGQIVTVTFARLDDTRIKAVFSR